MAESSGNEEVVHAIVSGREYAAILKLAAAAGRSVPWTAGTLMVLGLAARERFATPQEVVALPDQDSNTAVVEDKCARNQDREIGESSRFETGGPS